MSSKRNKSLASRLLEIACSHGPSIAWERGEEKYTYEELLKAALSCSKDIVAGFGKDEKFIPIIADKSFNCYTAILGAVFAGKTYVPLNPAFPTERNIEILKFIGSETFIEGGIERVQKAALQKKGFSLLKQIDWKLSDVPVGEVPEKILNRVLYLLFTSGSTGTPKGVPVSEKNLLAYLDNIIDIVDIGHGDRCSQVFDLTFDLSVHDLFVTWATGACLVVPEEQSPLFYSKFIKNKKITAWFSVPSTIQLFDKMRLLKKGAFPTLKTSLFCGEAFPSRLAARWQEAAPASALFNLYGPTEATISISYYEIPSSGPMLERNGVVSIGKVFKGHKQKLGDGSKVRENELLLSGPQVVEGYYNNKEQSDKAFISEGGDKYYSTGDIVEMDNEGNLFFLGRKDQEIKLHGYRINLLEIDHTISMVLEGDAVVSVLTGPDTARKIISFVPERTDEDDMQKEILDHCRRKLPWYMVPERIIFVEDFPLNKNGKIDRVKLAELSNERS